MHIGKKDSCTRTGHSIDLPCEGPDVVKITEHEGREHEVSGCVDDGLVELENRRGFRGQLARQALDLRIEPHAHQ